MQANTATARGHENPTPSPAPHLTERLKVRLRHSAPVSTVAITKPPCLRNPETHDQITFITCDREHDPHRPRDPRSFLTRQRLHIYLKTHQHAEFRHELARAELSGEISEFYALSFQAVLAMAEGSELATEYLEMAEAVASSPYERA